MKKLWMILSLFLVCLLLPASSFAIEIGARGYYYLTWLDGDVRVDDSGIAGTKIGLSGDLGLDDDNYPSIEVFGGIGDHHLRPRSVRQLQRQHHQGCREAHCQVQIRRQKGLPGLCRAQIQ